MIPSNCSHITSRGFPQERTKHKKKDFVCEAMTVLYYKRDIFFLSFSFPFPLRQTLGKIGFVRNLIAKFKKKKKIEETTVLNNINIFVESWREGKCIIRKYLLSFS